MKSVYLFIAFCVIAAGCVTAPDFSDVPVLTYVGVSKTSMVQSSIAQDSIIITLSFTDGDGNVGIPDGERDQNVTIIDNRTGSEYARFSTPVIPEEGVGNGVEVVMRLLLLNDCCVFNDPSIPGCAILPESNTFTMDVTIRDQDGNESNTVTTEPITFICGS